MQYQTVIDTGYAFAYSDNVAFEHLDDLEESEESEKPSPKYHAFILYHYITS